MAVPPNTPPTPTSASISRAVAALGAGSDGRMAVVVKDPRGEAAAEKLVSVVPTVVATTLSCVVETLAKHEVGAMMDDQASQEAGGELLVGVDIRQLPTADTMLLAEGLRHSRACGAVFVMSEGQFALFDRALFHFVLA